MAKKKIDFKPGDIFSIPLHTREVAYGRILLDVYNQGLKKGQIDKTSPLYFTDRTIFVELYKELSTDRDTLPENLSVLIPGIFTAHGFLKGGFWKIHKNEAVVPEEMDFPEFVSPDGAFKSVYTKGEIRASISIPFEETNAMGLNPVQVPGLSFPDLILHKLGRKEEMKLTTQENADHMDLGKKDLRFSQHRGSVLEKVPEEYKGPYYETSKALGFDLKRLF